MTNYVAATRATMPWRVGLIRPGGGRTGYVLATTGGMTA